MNSKINRSHQLFLFLGENKLPHSGFSSTHNIANKGFGGMRGVVARFNFSCTLIGKSPKTLTGHIVNRYRQF
jgi:hypothetical protein